MANGKVLAADDEPSNLRLISRLRAPAVFEHMILTLARMIEARDPKTGDHCERLAAYAVRLGRQLGSKDDELVALKRGGFLHDIGKVAISLVGNPLLPDSRSVT